MKSKFFLILLSVSMATAALGVAQVGAYDIPKETTPAAPEPTNRNQSALETAIQKYKKRNHGMPPVLVVMDDGSTRLKSATTSMTSGTDEIYDEDGNFVRSEECGPPS